MSYIFGKLWHLTIIWAIRKSFQCILQGVRFLLAKQTRLSGTSDNESYIPDKQLLRLSGLSKGNVIYHLLSPKTLCLRVRQILDKSYQKSTRQNINIHHNKYFRFLGQHFEKSYLVYLSIVEECAVSMCYTDNFISNVSIYHLISTMKDKNCQRVEFFQQQAWWGRESKKRGALR